jgi:hypothetical protein
MTGLNLVDNNIGQLVMSDGWQFDKGADEYWKEVEGEELVEKQLPAAEQLAIESPVGAIAITNAIKDMGALTSLHVGKNDIPEKEMREIMAIAMHMESMKILCGVPFKDKTLTELDVSGNNLGMEGALVITAYLNGNGALTSLDISDNTLCGLYSNGRGTYNGAGVEALSDLLKVNSVLKELNMSKTYIGPEGAKVLSLGLSVNRAISQFTFSGDEEDSKPVTMETSMTEADFSVKGLGESGTAMAAAFLPKCM